MNLTYLHNLNMVQPNLLPNLTYLTEPDDLTFPTYRTEPNLLHNLNLVQPNLTEPNLSNL